MIYLKRKKITYWNKYKHKIIFSCLQYNKTEALRHDQLSIATQVRQPTAPNAIATQVRQPPAPNAIATQVRQPPAPNAIATQVCQNQICHVLC